MDVICGTIEAFDAEEPQEARYHAFISYSRHDRLWAQWLQRALERFEVPRHLAGRETPAGTLPARLFPVFLDRDELPSAPDLGRSLDEALRAASHMIVICSPAAARSRWVDAEIRGFQRLGRADRILALIVDGIPNAVAEVGGPECLPQALRTGVDGQALPEPLGADLRPGGDGRTLALLRLISGLLSLPLDELRQRDRQRQRLKWIAWGGGCALFLAAVLSLVVQLQIDYRHVEQRAERGQTVGRSRGDLTDGHDMIAALRLASVANGLSTAESALLDRAMQPADALQAVMALPDGARTLAFSSDDAQWLLADDTHLMLWSVVRRRAVWTTHLSGHPQDGAQFSPDGQRVVLKLMTADGPVLQVLDTHDGSLLLQVAVSSEQSAQQALSEDATQLLAVDAQARARLWAVGPSRSAGMQLDADVSATRYSASAHRLAVARADGYLDLFDSQTHRRISQWPHGLDHIRHLLFAPDGRWLGATDWRGALKVWQVDDGQVLLAAGQAGVISTLQSDRRGRRLLTVASDGIRVWDIGIGHLLSAWRPQGDEPERAELSPDGESLLRISDQQVDVLDAVSSALRWRIERNAPLALAHFSQSGTRLATADTGGPLMIWNAELRPSATIGGPDPAWPGDAPALAAGDGPTLFSAAGRDTMIELSSISLKPTGRRKVAGFEISALAATPDGREAMAGGSEGQLSLWSPDIPRSTSRAMRAGGRVAALSLAPGGAQGVAITASGEASLWDLSSGQELGRWQLDGLQAHAWTLDGQRLALGVHGIVIEVDARSGREIRQREEAGTVPCLAYAADGSGLMVIRSDAASVPVWYPAEGKQTVHGSPEPLMSGCELRSAPAQHRFLVRSDSGALALWEPGSRDWDPLMLPRAPITQMRWSFDAAFFATGDRSGAVVLWDAVSGRPLITLGQHRAAVAYLEFVDGGKRLVTAARHGRTMLWRVLGNPRAPAVLADRLSCAVPWRLKGRRLLPTNLLAAPCLRSGVDWIDVAVGQPLS